MLMMTMKARQGELTLRSGGDEINEQLEQKLNERLAMAGMEVVEGTYQLPCICTRNCCRNASSPTGFGNYQRTREIVEGAVSMVHMALDSLEKDQIVELDDDKEGRYGE